LGVDGPVFPGPEAEHDPLFEGFGLDPRLDGRVASVEVGEHFRQLGLKPLPVVGHIRNAFNAENVEWCWQLL